MNFLSRFSPNFWCSHLVYIERRRDNSEKAFWSPLCLALIYPPSSTTSCVSQKVVIIQHLLWGGGGGVRRDLKPYHKKSVTFFNSCPWHFPETTQLVQQSACVCAMFYNVVKHWHYNRVINLTKKKQMRFMWFWVLSNRCKKNTSRCAL